ncbi:MAG: D-aminoacylase [Oscillospiraceae bacterium]|nr:D-aminoacylase [Oscillospiraceae bacterium]
MYDILIKNGKVIDGQNNAPYYADIAVTGDEIVKIADKLEEPAKRIIDAKGKIVTPGFIDIHCHSDAIVFHEAKNPLRLRQGFTTEVIGNCGISAAPVSPKNLELLRKYCAPFYSNVPLPYNWKSYGEYLDELEAHKPMLNTVGLVGHGTLRIAVSGFEARPLTAGEMEQMDELLEASMEEGAYGLSSGLIYPPGVFANQDEMMHLAKVVKAGNGIYASHMRSESSQLVEAVQEIIQVAEETGTSVEISHHKAQGVRNYGKTKTTLRLIQEANARGLHVNCDVYPYLAASTQFSAVLPPWALEGGVDKLVARVSDPETRARILADVKCEVPPYENFFQYAGSWSRILINECTVKEYEGKTVQQIAEENHTDPYEMALDIIRNCKNNVMMIVFTMSEEDVSRVIQDPNSMICTDGFPGLGPYHPRYTAGFTRILEKYVKQDNLLSLQQAIYKMSGMPAAKLGLTDRGWLDEGNKADLLVLDMGRIHDNADYRNYNAGSDGIDYVLINGQIALDDGVFQPVCAGRVLRKPNGGRK